MLHQLSAPSSPNASLNSSSTAVPSPDHRRVMDSGDAHRMHDPLCVSTHVAEGHSRQRSLSPSARVHPFQRKAPNQLRVPSTGHPAHPISPMTRHSSPQTGVASTQMSSCHRDRQPRTFGAARAVQEERWRSLSSEPITCASSISCPQGRPCGTARSAKSSISLPGAFAWLP